MKRKTPLRSKRWGSKLRGKKSPQTERTRLKRFGPPGYTALVVNRPCAVRYCPHPGPMDPAHVVSRGRGGGWRNNIVCLCRTHHRQLDEDFGKDPETFHGSYGVDLHRIAEKITQEWDLKHG